MKNKIKPLYFIPLVFFVSSCVYVPLSDFDWYKIGEPSKNTAYIQVQDPDSTCRELGAKTATFNKILACAVYSPELCKVFTEYPENEIPNFIKEHEDLHCQGFSHN